LLACHPCAKRLASYLKSTGCAAKGFCPLTSLRCVLSLFSTNLFHPQLQFSRTSRPLRNFALGSKSIRGNVRVMCKMFSGVEYCLFVSRVLKRVQLFHLKGCRLGAVQNVNRNPVEQLSTIKLSIVSCTRHRFLFDARVGISSRLCRHPRPRPRLRPPPRLLPPYYHHRLQRSTIATGSSILLQAAAAAAAMASFSLPFARNLTAGLFTSRHSQAASSVASVSLPVPPPQISTYCSLTMTRASSS
jgi:hypothetical protein